MVGMELEPTRPTHPPSILLPAALLGGSGPGWALGRTGGMWFPWELPKFSSQSCDVAAGFGAKHKVQGAGRGLAIHC